jgi:hypothetical protein
MTDSSAGAVLHLANDQTIVFAGLTEAELQDHPGDFHLS